MVVLMEKGQKLPAPDFCNQEGGGRANPIYGRGALGNQYAGRMYYSGDDREEHITLVQTMLMDLGYDVGSAGADGKFGNDTEKAVRKFQEEHADWGGEKLNVDGLVGPETADALNRAMVGANGWYDRHQTEKELTVDFALMTARSDAFQQPVSFDVGGVTRGKVVLTGEIKKRIPGHISLLLRSNSGAVPLQNLSYRIRISESRILEGKTDEDGLVSHPDIPFGDYPLEIEGLEGSVLIPAISQQHLRRLTRIPGYYLYEEGGEAGGIGNGR